MPAFVARGYRVITYDRLGSGRSRLAADAAAGTAADDLQALTTQLGLTRFHLVGTAAGGIVALDYAVSFPQRLRGLVVANSIGGVQDPTTWRWDAGCGRRRNSISCRRSCGRSARRTARAIPRALARWMEIEHASRPQVPGTSPPTHQEPVDVPLLESLSVPTLLITGGADLYAPPPVMRMFAARIQGRGDRGLSRSRSLVVLGGRGRIQPGRAGVPGETLMSPSHATCCGPRSSAACPSRPGWPSRTCCARRGACRAPRWPRRRTTRCAWRCSIRRTAGLDGRDRRRDAAPALHLGLPGRLDRHRHRAADEEAVARRPLQRADRGGAAGGTRGAAVAGVRGRVPLRPRAHHAAR